MSRTNNKNTQKNTTPLSSNTTKRVKKIQNNKHKISKIRLADPYYSRESAQYESPLPSREYIQQILSDHGVPMTLGALIQALDILPHENEHFERRLSAMERDGQLVRNRRDAYLLPDKADLIPGRVEGHPDGYGFLVRDDGGPDIFLGPKAMREILHRDRAIVRITGQDRKGRPEGSLIQIIERANKRIVGRVLNEHGVLIVVPENKRLTQDVLIAPGSGKKPNPGQVVTVELIEQPTRYAQPIGRVTEILGDYTDPGMEIEIALRKHELPFEFSAEAAAEARKLPATVRQKDRTGRTDLTHLPLVTIDGETAKDFDDAVYCERQGNGYRLIVAIADVSHYVQHGSALDRDAYERGNSVYFPRRVIPMLPEKLSNGLCSLNPDVDRLAMVADVNLTATGALANYRFYPAVIRSHARLTYTQVAAALYENDVAARKNLGDLVPHLVVLDQLFRILLKNRAKRGAIDFETTETRMVFDDNGKIERIEPEVRNDAHRLIEECMLTANVCAADFLAKHEHAGLYRIHEGPSEDKLDKLRAFLAEFGLGLTGGDTPGAKDYSKLLATIRNRPDAQLLQTVMLRSLKQALYSPDNVGHFGLAYDAYSHFTSPIRRYPDLMVHRSIKAVLNQTTYTPGDWEEIGLHCSMTERRADEATRDVTAWLKCYFMQDRVGEIFTGSISSVVPFGLFVALDDIFIEGLVHVSDLGSDYFLYDPTRHALVGERTAQQYRLSDRIQVQLIKADMTTNKIDFRLVEKPLQAEEKKQVSGVKRLRTTTVSANRTTVKASAPRTKQGATSAHTGETVSTRTTQPAKTSTARKTASAKATATATRKKTVASTAVQKTTAAASAKGALKPQNTRSRSKPAERSATQAMPAETAAMQNTKPLQISLTPSEKKAKAGKPVKAGKPKDKTDKKTKDKKKTEKPKKSPKKAKAAPQSAPSTKTGAKTALTTKGSTRRG